MNIKYLESLTKVELKEYAEARKIKVSLSSKKKDILDKILESIGAIDEISSVIYEQAIIKPHDDSFDVVVGLTMNIYENNLKKGERLVNLSFVSYKIISNAILSNTLAFIQHKLMTNEVMPWEVIIGDSITIDNVKDSSIAKIRTFLTPEISKASGLSLYGFMVLNNELVAKGFAIYEENREEVYLKILETGDDKLITKLEDYLNYKDEIDRVSQLERQFSNAIHEIQDSDSIEDIMKVENEFIKKLIPQIS